MNAEQETKQSTEAKVQDSADTDSETEDRNKEVMLHKLTMVPFKEHKHGAPLNEELFNIGVLKLNFGQVLACFLYLWV